MAAMLNVRAHISRWLPADTRTVELSSCLALLFTARAALGDAITVSTDHPGVVWAVMLAALALLQCVGAVRELGPLRVLASFVSGLWWIWSGLASDGLHTQPGDFAAVALGVSLMYSFVLHGSTVAHQVRHD